jgi:dUTP pyrophosphatase
MEAARNQVLIKVRKLHPAAVLPTKATNGSAGFDIYAIEPAVIQPIPGGATLRTGLAVELPSGYEMQIRGRSGLAFREDIVLHLGTIDQDYRGEVLIKLWNLGAAPFKIAPGDRIAQAVIQKIEPAHLTEVSEISDTERGAGGFGHTGR